MTNHIAIGSVRDRDLSDPRRRGVWTCEYPTSEDEAREILRQWAREGRDVYRSIYRRTQATHAEGPKLCLPSSRIAFEVDAVADNERARALLKRVDPTLVSSGTRGHYHVYVTLSEVLPWVELKGLARGLYRAVGVTDGGKYGGGFLRLPGSLNHKYDPPRPVRSVRRGGVVPVETLRSIVDAHTPPVCVSTALIVKEEPYGDLSTSYERRKILRILNEGDGGGVRRHRLTFKLIRLCQEAGLTQGQTLSVLLDHTASLDKFDERTLPHEVLRCWYQDSPAGK